MRLFRVIKCRRVAILIVGLTLQNFIRRGIPGCTGNIFAIKIKVDYVGGSRFTVKYRRVIQRSGGYGNFRTGRLCSGTGFNGHPLTGIDEFTCGVNQQFIKVVNRNIQFGEMI